MENVSTQQFLDEIVQEEVQKQLIEAPQKNIQEDVVQEVQAGEQNVQQEEISDHIKGVIETLLFISEKPVTLDQIKGALETVSGAEVKAVIKVLQNDYQERKSGMTIIEIAGGYQMLSNPVYATYIREFYKTKHKERLSKPALESLAIIAYKQPVTRSDIELIRGVNSDGVVNHLLSKELLKTVGRKDVAGRPYLYGTTKQFLEYFGLKSLKDLPKLEEFPSLLPPEEVEERPVVNEKPKQEKQEQESVEEKKNESQ
ncbi:Segregation and condensation protein B [hydrothermal vent metagenome]|uniref:Segregation and condensation protein B n=1 Tax=hydrothermal vent metagenome TaxID=652676 RepID=A0A3B1DKP8_9ZZZZ